ncbi:MAG: hypothetical protein GY847_23795 [Proteobacteria bacterium]|nr:hypothetical protein [Pseudomonadota bacterium]
MNVQTKIMRNRFYEIIAEDARIFAAEWREMGVEDARTMLAMTREAMEAREPLPEPAQQIKDQIRNHMTAVEVEIAWPMLLNKISTLLR